MLLAALATLWLVLPAAAAGPTVSLGPPLIELAAGEVASLPVDVADVEDLYGAEIHLQFDPAVIQVVDADPGSAGIQVAPGVFLSTDFVAQNQVDNQTGVIHYAVTQVNPSEPRSGSGTLFTIRFQGTAAGGVSSLEATDQVLATRDGASIPVTVTRGEIRAEGVGPAERPATSTPTSERSTATPSATLAPKAATGGDAPTVTRAFTNTPVAVVADGTPASQLSAPTAIAFEPTPSPLPTPIPVAAGEIVQPGATVPPTLTADPPSQPNPTATADQPTPALVARVASGSAGKAILEPGAAADGSSVTQSEPAQAGQPGSSWLLIGAVVLLSLAVFSGVVILWLSVRRRRT